MEDYAKKHGFDNFRHFTDDGISGTTFERKGFKAMIEEVMNGNISTIIVKDMSRFGRDYLKVGYYTEIMFVEKGVRFIAINNNIDSANQTDSDFTPFLNIKLMGSLSKNEQETIINFNAGEQSATVYTRDKAVMRKLDALVIEFPEVYKLVEETDIDKTYSMPKSCVNYRKPRKLDDKYRELKRVQMVKYNMQR